MKMREKGKMSKTIKQKELEDYKTKLLWSKLTLEKQEMEIKSKLEVLKQEINKYSLLIKSEEDKTKSFN